MSRGGGREAAEVISCVSTNKVKELLRQVSTPKYNVTLFHPLYFVRNNVPEGVTKPWAANPQEISRLPIAEIGSPMWRLRMSQIWVKNSSSSKDKLPK